MFGVGDASLSDQLQLSQPRLKDIKDMQQPITIDGIDYQIVARFVVGDYPARAFETGQQIGGKFSCPCGLASEKHSNLCAAFHNENSHQSLHSRAVDVQKGVLWKHSPYGILKEQSKANLLLESRARDLYIGTTYQRPSKSELNQQLVTNLKGLQRIPAIAASSPEADLQQLCPSLEVPNCEVLHDFLGVFDNLLEEMPCHFSALRTFSMNIRKEHNRLRGIDARFAAIKMVEFCIEFDLPQDVLQIAQQLVEISEICYSYAHQRTPRTVLRLYNLTFSLGSSLVDIVGQLPKKVSAAKFYGIHFHGLTTHLPEVHRIVNIRSLVPEQEEASFYRLKQLSLHTSNRHPQHVVDNAILRSQFSSSNSKCAYQQSVLARQAGKVIMTLLTKALVGFVVTMHKEHVH